MEQNQQSEFHFVDTNATRKIFSLKKRIRAITGGTSASKTISILVWLIDYCQSPKNAYKNKIVTVVSESYPHLSKGAMTDFEMIMKDRHYWKDELWNKKGIYTFESGNKLEFYSVDTYGKAHGPRRDILFLNECNNLSYQIVDQLIIRTRETIFMDWNPTSSFWFYEDMLPMRDDIDFITLTYLDNDGLDETTKLEIESHRSNKAWWQVYGLGQLGTLEGSIYRDWTILDAVPQEARLEKYGLDFGYSNDPTASDAIYKWNDAIVLDQVIHQKGLSNRQIAETYQNMQRALVIADSAEPKSIDEIASYGVPIIAAVKGADSVNQGIQLLQSKKVFITKRSVETLKEYRNYLWMTDKDGKIINEPSPIWNHHMDDIRYAVSSGITQKPWRANDPGGIRPFYPELGI